MNRDRPQTLLLSERILATEVKIMEEEFGVDGHKWDREKMINHAGQRQVLIKARQVLLDRLEE